MRANPQQHGAKSSRAKRGGDRAAISDRTAAWLQRAQAPVDIASLAVFRIAFGAILFIEVCRFFWHGWITEVYVAPNFHFSYYGLSWLRPWPGVGMYFHFGALGALAAMIAVGWRYRWATILFAVGFTYVFLLEKAQYLNHFYLLCLVSVLMVLVPAHRAFSWDARRDPAFRSNVAPAWSLWILRAQIAIPYFFGGLAKLNYDWLHGQPMQMWMAEMEQVRAIVPAFGEMWLALLFSYGGLLFDLLVVPLLLWRRTRMIAFWAAVGFHLCNAVMFHIGIFPWFMIAATTLFLEPDWPRRWWRRFRAGNEIGTRQARRAGAAVHSFRPLRPWAVAATAVFFGVQCVLPFRPLLYPGDSNWTGEGQRFAWRMMLHSKQSAIRMVVTDPRSGRSEPVDLAAWLTVRQLDVMSHFPEMMREFAHFVRDRYALAGVPKAEVRVFVLCSLNGRRPQLLIDPAVDLAAQPRTIYHQPYIVPLHEPLRDQPWDVPVAQWEQHLAPRAADR